MQSEEKKSFCFFFLNLILRYFSNASIYEHDRVCSHFEMDCCIYENLWNKFHIPTIATYVCIQNGSYILLTFVWMFFVI